MELMTVKEFNSLSQRDFENGAVRDSIREALKEKEVLIQNQPKVTDELIEEKAREIWNLWNLWWYKASGSYVADFSGTIRFDLGGVKKLIRHLYEEMPAKKATVSGEFVEKWRAEFIKGFEAPEDNIILMLREAGLEVVEK